MNGLTHEQLTERLKVIGARRAQFREQIEHLNKQLVDAQRNQLANEGQYALMVQLIEQSVKGEATAPALGSDGKA